MLNALRSLLPKNSRQYREETSARISWGHWFSLFNIVLALIIASRYAFNADWPNTLLGKLYFFISLLGHFSFVVFAFYLLLLFPLSFLIKNHRAFRGVAVISATIAQTVLLVDTEVFGQFYLHLSPLVWDLLVNPDNGELSRQWQLLFVPMPLILLAEMLYSRWTWQKLRSLNRQRFGKYVGLFFILCFSATHLIYTWADMQLYRPITAQKANYPLSYPMTARGFLEKHGLIDRTELEQTLEEKGQLDAFYLNYPKKPLQIGSKSQVNFLIINLSGLRNDAISTQNMPNLSQFSWQSHRFKQHYSAADTNSASVMGIFYSLSGKYLDSVLSERASSPLIDTLQQSGYQFGLFSHNGFAEPLYHRALFADFKLPQTKDNDSALTQWQQWLGERPMQQPFFSYLDLTLPEANSYAEQTQRLDRQFAQIWQQLQAQSLTERTLIIVTADLAESQKQTNSFDKDRIQVPMMLYWQGEGITHTQLTSHLDIMPTLLTQFFAVKTPLEDYAQGINLSAEHQRIWLLASNRKWNVAIMNDDEQYHLDKKGHFEHFDSQGEAEKVARPPLALFLQVLRHSNQFIAK